MKRVFRLIHDQARNNAILEVSNAPDGYIVSVGEPTRTLEQNAKFHAMLQDVADKCMYAGKRLSMESWKALFVSGHAIATKQGGEALVGMEGEFVAIRESTAHMSKQRSASLIEYVLAWCAMNDIELTA